MGDSTVSRVPIGTPIRVPEDRLHPITKECVLLFIGERSDPTMMPSLERNSAAFYPGSNVRANLARYDSLIVCDEAMSRQRRIPAKDLVPSVATEHNLEVFGREL